MLFAHRWSQTSVIAVNGYFSRLNFLLLLSRWWFQKLDFHYPGSSFSEAQKYNLFFTRGFSGADRLDQRHETSGQRTLDRRRLLDRNGHLETRMGARGRSSVQLAAQRAPRLQDRQPPALHRPFHLVSRQLLQQVFRLQLKANLGHLCLATPRPQNEVLALATQGQSFWSFFASIAFGIKGLLFVDQPPDSSRWLN